MTKRNHIGIPTSISPDFGRAFKPEYVAQILKQAKLAICKLRFLDSACHFAVTSQVNDMYFVVTGRLGKRVVDGANVYHLFRARSIVAVKNRHLAELLINLPSMMADSVFSMCIEAEKNEENMASAWVLAMKFIHSMLNFFPKAFEKCVANVDLLDGYARCMISAATKYGLGLISESLAIREILGLFRNLKCDAV